MSLVKAFFEFRSDGFLVVALADKDDLVFAVAVAGIPVFAYFGIIGESVPLFFFVFQVAEKFAVDAVGIDVDASHVVDDKGDFSQGKKQDIAVKVLTDYAERAGGARGLEN